MAFCIGFTFYSVNIIESSMIMGKKMKYSLVSSNRCSKNIFKYRHINRTGFVEPCLCVFVCQKKKTQMRKCQKRISQEDKIKSGNSTKTPQNHTTRLSCHAQLYIHFPFSTSNSEFNQM